VRNERRLARRAAQGDPDAFAAIFQRYQHDLYRYCVAILGDPQDAQDALQNTMVKVLAALPGERREIELRPWLYRVAHNESIELRRRRRPSGPPGEDAPAPGASLEQRAADRGRLRDLLADIGELPERQRGALVMRELAGLDFEQIGEALDASPAAARQILYEARRGLQQMSEGREMDCEAVAAILSERDRRVVRRRDVRAHLRGCLECRRFGEAIGTRKETLAGISPLPAVAAAAIAKGTLSGAAGGGASTGGAGAAAGVAGASAKTAAIMKSAAGIVAVVAVSAVAVDHGPVFGGSPVPAGVHGRPIVVVGGPRPPVDAAPTRRNGPIDIAAGQPRPWASHLADHTQGVSSRRPVARRVDASSPAGSAGGAGVGGTEVASAGTSGLSGGGQGATRVAESEPEHPAHPTHPAHPSRPEHPEHPVKSSHAADPSQSARAESAAKHSTATTVSPPEHPEHPSHPAKAGGESASQESLTAEPEATAAGELDEAGDMDEAAPPSPNPGQAKKEASD
jgi:RNA polymerase sigma factor (sigma-70 family)